MGNIVLPYHDTDNIKRLKYLRLDYVHFSDSNFKTHIISSNDSDICSVIVSTVFHTLTKRDHISGLLILLNYKLNTKHRLLAALEIYNNIPNVVKHNITLFLQIHNILPEIRKYIIKILIDTYKYEFNPLPINFW